MEFQGDCSTRVSEGAFNRPRQLHSRSRAQVTINNTNKLHRQPRPLKPAADDVDFIDEKSAASGDIGWKNTVL